MQSLALRLELHPRQMAALKTPARELLFGGASGGGKSHFVRVAMIGWCLAIPGLQCVLIRKKYDDIIKNHIEGPSGFRALLTPLINAKAVEVTQQHVRFANGSLISYNHCQDERQFDSAQGVEKHVLVIDEATQISERLIRFFRAWARVSEDFKATMPAEYRGTFPRIIYTANPIGPSVGFFRREFVKARPAFHIEPVSGFPRQYIPSRVTDNLSMDAEEHRGRLEGLGDPGLIRALYDGDWDAPVGDFFPEWSEERHVIPDFRPPSHWFRYRSFDWGTAEPFCVHWWAVSDGESFRDDRGGLRWLPRGAIVGYREWYGCDPERPAQGLRLRNEDIAAGILRRSIEDPDPRVITLTDKLPFQDRGGKTIAETFAENGVLLTEADTSRVPGWSQLRARLIGKFVDSNDKERTPMIFFTESCAYARDYIPSLPRHPKKPEDAAEDGEATHACDSVRYACHSRPIVVDEPAREPDPAHMRGINSMTFNDAIAQIQAHKREQSSTGW